MFFLKSDPVKWKSNREDNRSMQTLASNSLYTAVLRKSSDYWVALCLENGIVGQGETQAQALTKLKEAIASWQEAYLEDGEIYSAAVSIDALHEFLTFENVEPRIDGFELKVIYA
jgi:predicted RNase H-like HicB family nuclease